MIKGIYDFLDTRDVHNNFTVGINDDVTNLSLEYDDNFKVSDNGYQMLIYGYGSDGMVSTSKDILKIVGDNTNEFVQGYFQYDSKKSGGVTRSHIRFSDKEIKSTYYVDNPDFIVVSKDSYMYKYDILDNLKEGGVFFLNTNLDDVNLIKSLPNKVKYLLARKKARFYVIDAYEIVNKLGLKNKINTCMETCIFKIMDNYDINKIIKIMKENNKLRFASKGQNIININDIVNEEDLVILKTNSFDNKMIDLMGYSRKEVTNILELLDVEYELQGTGYVFEQSILVGEPITDKIIVKLNNKY